MRSHIVRDQTTSQYEMYLPAVSELLMILTTWPLLRPTLLDLDLYNHLCLRLVPVMGDPANQSQVSIQVTLCLLTNHVTWVQAWPDCYQQKLSPSLPPSWQLH